MSRKRRGRGEGAIFQRRDGLWSAEVSQGYDEAGKRRRKTVYGKSKGEVQEKLRQLQNQAVEGAFSRLADPGKFTMGDLLTLWLKIAQVKVAPSTYARYEQQVRLHLGRHLGALLLAQLGEDHVWGLFKRMRQEGASEAECHKVGKVLRSVLKLAVKRKLLPGNVASDVPLPRTVKEEIHPLDARQCQQVLAAAAGDRLYALYAVALDSGMRQGELFGLQWPDLDLETGHISVTHSLEEINGHLRLKDVKTKAARRRIKLSRLGLDALQEHRKSMLVEGRDVKTGPVFCDTGGGWLRKSNMLRQSFTPILLRAGLPAETRFHDLRHTCATLLLLAEVNVKVVSERLGHAKIQITLDTYQHVLPTMQEAAAEALTGIFAASG
jgi:integrase